MTYSRRLDLADAELFGQRTNLLDVEQRILELLGGRYEHGRLLRHLELEFVALVHLQMRMARVAPVELEGILRRRCVVEVAAAAVRMVAVGVLARR